MVKLKTLSNISLTPFLKVLLLIFITLFSFHLLAQNKSPKDFTTVRGQIEKAPIEGAVPVYFDQSLADLLGLKPPPGRIGTKEFDEWLIKNFAFEIKNGGKKETFISSLLHSEEVSPSKKLDPSKFVIEDDAHNGSGRAGYLFVPTPDDKVTWVNIKGIGITGYGNTTEIPHGPPSSTFTSHKDGSATLEEAIKETVMARVSDNDTKRGASRVLAIIHTGRVITYPDGNKVPLAIIVRAPLRRYDQELPTIKMIDTKRAAAETLAFINSRRLMKGDFVNDSNMGAQGELIDFGCLTHTCGYGRLESSQKEFFLKEGKMRISSPSDYQRSLGIYLLNQMGIPEADILDNLSNVTIENKAQSAGESFVGLVSNGDFNRTLLDFEHVDKSILHGKLKLHLLLKDMAHDFFSSDNLFTKEEWTDFIEKKVKQNMGLSSIDMTPLDFEVKRELDKFSSSTYEMLKEIREKKLADNEVRKKYAHAIKILADFKNREIEGIVRPNLFNSAGTVSKEFVDYSHRDGIQGYIENSVISNKLSTNSSGFGAISVTSNPQETSLFVRADRSPDGEFKLFTHPELRGAKSNESFFFRITTDDWKTHKDIKAKVAFNALGLPYFKLDIPHGSMPITDNLTQLVPFVVDQNGNTQWLKDNFNIKTSPLVINERLGLAPDFTKIPDTMRARYDLPISAMESDFAPPRIETFPKKELPKVATTMLELSKHHKDQGSSALYLLAMNLQQIPPQPGYSFGPLSEEVISQFRTDNGGQSLTFESFSLLNKKLWESHLKKINSLPDQQFLEIVKFLLNTDAMINTTDNQTLITFLEKVEKLVHMDSIKSVLLKDWILKQFKNPNNSLSSGWKAFFDSKTPVFLDNYFGKSIEKGFSFPSEFDQSIRPKLINYYTQNIESKTNITHEEYAKLYVLNPESSIFKNRNDANLAHFFFHNINHQDPQEAKRTLKILLKMKPEALNPSLYKEKEKAKTIHTKLFALPKIDPELLLTITPEQISSLLARLDTTPENLELFILAATRPELTLNDRGLSKLTQYPKGSIDYPAFDRFLRRKILSDQSSKWMDKIPLLKGDNDKNIYELLSEAYKLGKKDIFLEIISYSESNLHLYLQTEEGKKIKPLIDNYIQKYSGEIDDLTKIKLQVLSYDPLTDKEALKKALFATYDKMITEEQKKVFLDLLLNNTNSKEKTLIINEFMTELAKASDVKKIKTLIDELFINKSSHLWASKGIKPLSEAEIQEYYLKLSQVEGMKDFAYERMFILNPRNPILKNLITPEKKIEMLVKQLDNVKTMNDSVNILNTLLHFDKKYFTSQHIQKISTAISYLGKDESVRVNLRALSLDHPVLSQRAHMNLKRNFNNKIKDPVAIEYVKKKAKTSDNTFWAHLLFSIEGETKDHAIEVLEHLLKDKNYARFDSVVQIQQGYIGNLPSHLGYLIKKRIEDDLNPTPTLEYFKTLFIMNEDETFQKKNFEYAENFLKNKSIEDMDKMLFLRYLKSLLASEEGHFSAKLLNHLFENIDYETSPVILKWLTDELDGIDEKDSIKISSYIKKNSHLPIFADTIFNHYATFNLIAFDEETIQNLVKNASIENKKQLLKYKFRAIRPFKHTALELNLLKDLLKNSPDLYIERLKEVKVLDETTLPFKEYIKALLLNDQKAMNLFLSAEAEGKLPQINKALKYALGHLTDDQQIEHILKLESFLKSKTQSKNFTEATRALKALKGLQDDIAIRNKSYIAEIAANGLPQFRNVNLGMTKKIANELSDCENLVNSLK